MILITGASGKTGKAIIRNLANRGSQIRAMVHHPSQGDAALAIGANEVIVADFSKPDEIALALHGTKKVYAIFPNMYPEEVSAGKLLIETAKKEGVETLVYHSVLHPQISEMPHHINKLYVEEFLINSNLKWTILQPGAYMQNILGYLPKIKSDGFYSVPYPAQSILSLTDLEDIAEVATRVLMESGHEAAIYELVGPQPLSQTQIVEALSIHFSKVILAKELNKDEWALEAKNLGFSAYTIDTLLKMFVYYGRYGLTGNNRILELLLGRSATSFQKFLSRDVPKG